jgi:SAM-dependent methyltransferase
MLPPLVVQWGWVGGNKENVQAGAEAPKLHAMTRDPTLRAGTDAHYRDARYYDHFYRRRKEDVRFYVDLAERVGGPVLELGVGTGRVALAIARAGIPVVGVDRMAPMLARAAERLDREPKAVRARVELRKGDLLRLRLARRFPLVISPFNVFMHLYTRRDVEQALATVRHHLRPRGRFAFDVLMPEASDLARNPAKVYRGGQVTDPTTKRRYHYGENFQYDPVRQVQLITMAFQAKDDPTDLTVTPLAHRQFFPEELEALLHYNGLAIESRFGDFERGRLTGASESQIIIARKGRGR